MKSNKFIVENCGLQKHESKSLAVKMINDLIHKCHFDYLSTWEKDHSAHASNRDQQIELLKEKKKEIENFFKEFSSSDPSMDVHVTIEIKVKEETPTMA